jgi:hypothetical protein
MSRLGVTLTQDVGDAITVVPAGSGFMISFGRRQAEGAIFIDMPQAQAALLLSKLTRVFMEMEAPGPLLDAGVTTAGAAGRGVLADLRAKLEARGAELTAPADDCGPREDSEPPIAEMLRALEAGASADQVRERWGLSTMGESSLGSPSLSTALSNLGPKATRDQIRVALGQEPLGDEDATPEDVDADLGRFRDGNVVDLRSRRP